MRLGQIPATRLFGPKASIRRWMVLVLATAMVLGAGVAARDWFRNRQQVLSAHNDYLKSLAFYEQGRVTCLEVASRSRRLMDAECELAHSTGTRAPAISAHIRRLQSLRDEEAWSMEHELHYSRGGAPADLAELDEILVDARRLLALRR